MSKEIKAIILNNDPNTVEAVYTCEIRNSINEEFGLYEKLIRYTDLNDMAEVTKKAEYVFSTWGMPTLTKEEIAKFFPSVKAVFYAAGSVQAFARPWLECGVSVCSAWRINAYPVAEFAVSEILLAGKGFFYASRLAKEDYFFAQTEQRKFNGNYGLKVGILGHGGVGSRVIRLLKPYDVDIYCYAIDLTEEQAKKEGITLCSLQRIFEECDVISNHIADNPQTKGIISAQLINRMKSYSTFINTGRGAQVDEEALIEKLESDTTITALLDVSVHEPPETDSKLYTLKNAVLTPHIAGSNGGEVVRMARFAFEQSVKFRKTGKCDGTVTLKMLDGMA